MGILPILSILYALFAMGMATDAKTEVPTPPSPPELSNETDATLADALDKSEDVMTEENQEEEVIDALDDDDEVAESESESESAEAYSPVSLEFDQEVTEGLAEDDTPADSKAPIVKRVVGGSVLTSSSWRWQVSLQYKSGSRYRHFCGGVLIKRNWVLTTASCLDYRTVYRVVAGEQDLNKLSCNEQFLRVRQSYKHPDWKRNIYSGNDIALLRLRTYATLGTSVKLAILPSANRVLSSGSCYITGWGRTSTRGSNSNSLRYTYQGIVSRSICTRANYWGCKVKSNMICAGGSGSRSACYGDFGGPLNCYQNRRYEVHGLASFVSSSGCNIRRKPAVYTRVSAYRSWIKKVARA